MGGANVSQVHLQKCTTIDADSDRRLGAAVLAALPQRNDAARTPTTATERPTLCYCGIRRRVDHFGSR